MTRKTSSKLVLPIEGEPPFPAVVLVHGSGKDSAVDTYYTAYLFAAHGVAVRRLLSGLRRMTLNNARQDPSYINQCLGYQLFAAAGVPAPRCSFATVTVNGEQLGIYAHEGQKYEPMDAAERKSVNCGDVHFHGDIPIRAGSAHHQTRRCFAIAPPGLRPV